MRPAHAALLHGSTTGEQIAGGARSGPGNERMFAFEPVNQLGRSPVRMPAARLTKQLGHIRRDTVRAMMWRSTLIDQAAATFLVKAVDPLVAGFAADRVAGAEIGDRVVTT